MAAVLKEVLYDLSDLVVSTDCSSRPICMETSMLFYTLPKYHVEYDRLWVVAHFCSICVHSATTHSDLMVRAKTLGVKVEVIHNASVMNAVGACGLQLYRYGETISIPFFTETWRPDSFYDKIKTNRSIGLHTLCLLGNDSSPSKLAYQWHRLSEIFISLAYCLPALVSVISELTGTVLVWCLSFFAADGIPLDIDEHVCEARLCAFCRYTSEGTLNGSFV